MRRHPLFFFGWLAIATVMLSLAGLTAGYSPATEAGAGQIVTSGQMS